MDASMLNRRSVVAGCGALLGCSAVQARASFPPEPPALDPRSFGAKGDGRTDDRAAIQRAIDACSLSGGGFVVLPPGLTFVSGGLQLKSDVFLYLSPGSVLKASADRSSFGDRGALIFAQNAANTGVAGPGLIDGNYQAYLKADGNGGYAPSYAFLGRFDPEQPFAGASRPDGRPRVLLLVNCTRVSLAGFTVSGSASWTVHLLGCRDVTISQIAIRNQINVPNCDGIDIDRSQRVRIADCDITAGDDGICLKASAMFPDAGPCSDVTVTGTTITSGSSALKLGSGGSADIRNLVVTGCVITDSNRGIAMQNRDGRLYENLVFSDLVIETRFYPGEWWGAAEPIHISNLPRRRGQQSGGEVRGVTFSNIRCKSESGIFLYGAPGSPIRDIVLQNVDVEIAKSGPNPGGFYDLRPSWDNATVARQTIQGIHAEGVEGLALRDVDVEFTSPLDASYGSALLTRRVTGLDASRFRGRAARAGVPDRIEQ